MKKFIKNYGELLLGIVVLLGAGATVYFADVPIVWIGGFIWGISLIIQGVSKQKKHGVHNHIGILKERITCANCGQLLNVPVDRKRFVDITCPTCKKSPFHSIQARNKYSLLKYALFGIALITVIFLFYSFRKDDTIETQSVSPQTIVPTKSSNSELPHLPQKPVAKIETPSFFDSLPLDNGTIIKSRSAYLQGHGALSIKNGTDSDAVAKLIINNTSIFTVYIQKHNNYTIKNISDGIYELAFAFGQNWDQNKNVFTLNPSSEKFEESFDFDTEETTDSYYYSTFEVTLNPVVGGKAKTDDVNINEFNNY